MRATPRQIMVNAASTSQCPRLDSCCPPPTIPRASCERWYGGSAVRDLLHHFRQETSIGTHSPLQNDMGK